MEEKINYSRCGRTDKGVSALGQVRVLSLSPQGHWQASNPSGWLCRDISRPDMLVDSFKLTFVGVCGGGGGSNI